MLATSAVASVLAATAAAFAVAVTVLVAVVASGVQTVAALRSRATVSLFHKFDITDLMR